MANTETKPPSSATPTPPKPFNRAAFDRNKILLFVVLAVVFMSLPFVGKLLLDGFGTTVFSDTFSAVNTSLIFILLALGLNIVVGYAGLLDLGYAAFFAIGAYTMGFLTARQSPLYEIFHINFWLALPISFLMSALFGILLGAPTLGLRGDYLAIVTLGFGEIVPIAFRLWTKVTQGDTGLAGFEQPDYFGFFYNLTKGVDYKTLSDADKTKAEVFGFNFSNFTITSWYIVTLLVVFFSIFMIRRLVDSRIGRAWMAMREDEIAASSMGIDLVKTKLMAFSLGASFAGFAGAIFANSLGSANPSSFQFDVSVLVLSMIILGGLGNMWGVIFGAVALVMSDRYVIPFLTKGVRDFADTIQLESKIVDGTKVTEQNIMKEILTNVGSNSRLLIFGLILVTMMLLRPEGLFPSGRRKMELHAGDEKDAPVVG